MLATGSGLRLLFAELYSSVTQPLALAHRIIMDICRNVAGITLNDGMSSITSHYGYHMTNWHIVKALSGQRLDLSGAGPRTMTFSPKVPCPYSYPVLLPSRLATIACAENTYSLTLMSGDSLTLDILSVAGRPYPKLPVTLTTGHPLTWR